MSNKSPSKRSCFFAIEDINRNDVLWMIPISSRVEKYEKIYSDKIKKHGICDILVFGYVLGFKKAFLIQNIFPITKKYIDTIYLDTKNTPVQVDNILKATITKKSHKILQLIFQNKFKPIADIMKIYKSL
jgi:hypothetical protein